MELKPTWILVLEYHFLCRCFLAEAAPVTSRRAWPEFLRIEDDLGTCAFLFFKKSTPFFKHSGGGISLNITVSILHTPETEREKESISDQNQRVILSHVSPKR